MYRMGLIDFWYYTNEEFYFKNGHILLRGSNGVENRLLCKVLFQSY